MAVDRFDASSQIAKWLSNGKVVIANRYVGSNLGHQGGKISNQKERAKFFKWSLNLEYSIFGIPKPDINIILNVPPKQAQLLVDKKQTRSYIKKGKRDIHEDNLNHLTNAANIFKELTKIMPNTYMISCVENKKLLSPEVIHKKIWKLILPLIT